MAGILELNRPGVSGDTYPTQHIDPYGLAPQPHQPGTTNPQA